MLREKRAVITVSIGKDYETLVEPITHPYLKAYAKRIGAEFFVIRDLGTFPHPSYAKLSALNIIRRGDFDRVLLIDTDVVVQTFSPNIFEVVPRGFLGAFNEFYSVPRIGVLDSFNDDAAFKVWGKYYNCGVLVLDRHHFHVLERPETCVMHLIEQTWLNYRFFLENFPMFDIGSQFNRMSCMDRHGGAAKFESFFIHYAGLGPEKLVQQLRLDQPKFR